MKIGVISNLINIDEFVSNQLVTANSNEWMRATGGNTGNIAFVQGIKNILGDNVGTVHWGDNPKLVNQHYDQLVICCANQIGAHVDLLGWADRLKLFDLPTTFIGLGAQSDKIGVMPQIPEGSQSFLALTRSFRIDSNKPNIITRGLFSSEVLESFDVDSSPFGCPSQFISVQRDLGAKCLAHQQRAKFDRIMTAAGNPWHASASLEKVLVEIVKMYQGDYILQHPKALFQLALSDTELITPEQINRLEQVYAGIGDWDTIKSWFESFSVFFADAQNWMHYSRRFTLAIGPRYHGIALPIQAGVPGKVISIDSRTEELAVTTGVPTVHYKDVENMSAQDLVQQCRWDSDDAKNYDNVRTNNAGNYSDFLTANRLPVNKALTTLATQENGGING